MSWNSSTRTERKRQLSRSRIAGSSRRRSRACSWRSSKSSADSRVLRGGVRVGEAPEQLLEQRAVARGELVERRLLDRVARLLVRRRTARAARPARERRRGRAAARPRAAARAARAPARRSPSRVGLVHAGRRRRAHARRLAQLLDPRLEAGRSATSSDELPAGRAERLVDAASASGAARARRTWRAAGSARDRPSRRTSSSARVERLAGEHARPGSRRARGSAGRRRPRTDAPSAGGGRSRGSSRSRRRRARAPGRAGPSSREPRRMRPRSSPAARSVYVIASTESIGEAALADGAHEALDEHGRLAGAGARGDEDERRARRSPRSCSAFGVACPRPRSRRATRHIDQQVAPRRAREPPFGSCRTSPERMRSTNAARVLLRPLGLRPERVLVEVVALRRSRERRPPPRPGAARARAARRRARGRGRRAARCRRGRAARACRAGSGAAARTRSSPPSARSCPTCSPGRSRAR